MALFSKKTPENRETDDAHCREVRATMQDIVIAHTIICYKHMTREQIEAAQEEWGATVKGKGWAPFFADDDTPLPGPSWVALPEEAAGAETSRSSCSQSSTS